MKLIINEPITLKKSIEICASYLDVEINAPLKSLEGSVRVLGKTLVHNSTISAKTKAHVCGITFTHTTKISRINAEQEILIGAGRFRNVFELYANPEIWDKITIEL